jgi:pimeloyl-ACP methyl ester carboxylesterase
MSLSRMFSLLGRQANSARVASQRASSSSARGSAMKTTAFVLLLAVAMSACAPVAAAATKATPIPPTATAMPSTATSTAKPTVTVTGITELSGSFKVNGRSLYLKCLGTGSPTIVLEASEGATVSEMRKLQETLAERTTTCAYDRANLGRSSSAPTPRTAKDVVDDLHALLAASAVPGPYLLVGHSTGGLFVQLYARMFPDQVVGVVAMNPQSPAHPWLVEVNLIFTTQEYAGEIGYLGGENGESIDYLTSSEQLEAAPQPPDMPFEMLLSTDVQCAGDPICLKIQPIYERIMWEVTVAWQRGIFTQVVAGENIYSDDPDAVVAAVERVLASR